MPLARRVLVGSGLALVAGLAIAWVDTRPGWDDTGITVGLVTIAAGGASLVGAPFWLAALLVSGPMIVREIAGGYAVLVSLPIALVAAGLGALVKRALRS